MKYIMALGFLFLMENSYAQEILPAEIQIKTALQAAPADQKDNATVLGYDKDGKIITLRKGTGSLVCLADDPHKKGISVACYSANLEPFMARGRELLAQGKTEAQKQEIRNKEIDEGKLMLPKEPNILYVLNGTEENYDKVTGELKDGNIRYAFYVPYATLKSTGMSPKPSIPGMPWLMEAGTAKAHIMIVPPKKQ
ncbi:MAG TPA: hypothetical protein PLM81_00095 [Ginsengibacter sp.]|nr:hypothetical protein [Ginsengibacter sp.]HRP16706.1 hypothetical protein [Ginsengibacter sp.]HRP44479.1 hypothetical protein [Ginsengibacter sp.]